MAYCDVDDVKGLNPKRTYSGSTTPTTTQVEGYIDQIAAEIDTVLRGRGLTTPITTPSDFVTNLKLLNTQGAAALAEMAMFPEAPGTPGGTPHGALLWNMYRNGLKFLREGDLPVSLRGEAGPRSFQSEHDEKPDAIEDFKRPYFRRDKEF